MNSRTLKKHLKYIVPEMRLALIKEPGGKPLPIGCPEDLEKFVAPLKMYSEEHFVAFHLDAKNARRAITSSVTARSARRSFIVVKYSKRPFWLIHTLL